MNKMYAIKLIAAVFLLAVNVIFTSLILATPVVECKAPVKTRSLPCESVPLNWAVTHYDCANSLLLAMNVTNVKYLPPNSTPASITSARLRLQNRP